MRALKMAAVINNTCPKRRKNCRLRSDSRFLFVIPKTCPCYLYSCPLNAKRSSPMKASATAKGPLSPRPDMVLWRTDRSRNQFDLDSSEACPRAAGSKESSDCTTWRPWPSSSAPGAAPGPLSGKPPSSVWNSAAPPNKRRKAAEPNTGLIAGFSAPAFPSTGHRTPRIVSNATTPADHSSIRSVYASLP